MHGKDVAGMKTVSFKQSLLYIIIYIYYFHTLYVICYMKLYNVITYITSISMPTRAPRALFSELFLEPDWQSDGCEGSVPLTTEFTLCATVLRTAGCQESCVVTGPFSLAVGSKERP